MAFRVLDNDVRGCYKGATTEHVPSPRAGHNGLHSRHARALPGHKPPTTPGCIPRLDFRIIRGWDRGGVSLVRQFTE